MLISLQEDAKPKIIARKVVKSSNKGFNLPNQLFREENSSIIRKQSTEDASEVDYDDDFEVIKSLAKQTFFLGGKDSSLVTFNL